MKVEKRHLTHGFIDALIKAKRERRAYCPEEARQIAEAIALAESRQHTVLQ